MPAGSISLVCLFLAMSTLASCGTQEPEEVLPVMLLAAEDLPGEGWTASAEPVDPATAPQFSCGNLQRNLDTARLLSSVAGQTVVWSNGDYSIEETFFADGASSTGSLFGRFTYHLGMCHQPAPPGPPDEAQILVEEGDTQIVARERSYVGLAEDGIIGRADVGVREVGDYVVVIEVGYLEGVTPPDVVDLLDLAAANLPDE